MSNVQHAARSTEPLPVNSLAGGRRPPEDARGEALSASGLSLPTTAHQAPARALCDGLVICAISGRETDAVTVPDSPAELIGTVWVRRFPTRAEVDASAARFRALPE